VNFVSHWCACIPLPPRVRLSRLLFDFLKKHDWDPGHLFLFSQKSGLVCWKKTLPQENFFFIFSFSGGFEHLPISGAMSPLD